MTVGESSATGAYSVAEGYGMAYGDYSHAEGHNTITTVFGIDAHAEGSSTTANGYASHAEGGFTTADNEWEGTPHVLGWNEHKLEYWEATGGGGIEVHESIAGNTLQLANHDTASDGAIPYAKKDGNGLGWLQGVDGRVPLLHTDGAPTSMAIGSSLETANVSAVPTLNVANFASGGNCNMKYSKNGNPIEVGAEIGAVAVMA